LTDIEKGLVRSYHFLHATKRQLIAGQRHGGGIVGKDSRGFSCKDTRRFAGLFRFASAASTRTNLISIRHIRVL
jgi:hypothetical protein